MPTLDGSTKLIAREFSRKRLWSPDDNIVLHIQDDDLDARTDDENRPIVKIKGAASIAADVVDELRRMNICARLKTTKLAECGICGYYHPVDFNKDCRESGILFHTPHDSEDEAEYFDEDDDRNPDNSPNLSLEKFRPKYIPKT